MLFVRYKFRHIEHNNTTLCTHFSNLSLVTFVDDTTKWCSVKSLQDKLLRCTICCLKFAFRTCTPGISRWWRKCDRPFGRCCPWKFLGAPTTDPHGWIFRRVRNRVSRPERAINFNWSKLHVRCNGAVRNVGYSTLQLCGCSARRTKFPAGAAAAQFPAGKPLNFHYVLMERLRITPWHS